MRPWTSPLPCRKDIQAGALGSHREAAIIEVGGAGPFRRNHAGADGRLRRTGGAEDLAHPGFDDALEDLTTLAGFGISHTQPRHLIAQLGVPVGKLWTQLQRAMRDEA